MAPNQDSSRGRTVQERNLHYIQRSADTELLDHCQNGRPAYILHSPQTGKSSLLTHTADQLNGTSHQAVLIDLSQFPLPQREEEWFLNIVRILDDHLDLSTDAISWWAKPSVFALPPYIRLTKLITEVILPEITTHLVLFIDEIERTAALPFREHFFEWLTTLYESRATDSILYRLSFVVCGVATPPQLIPEDGPLLFQWSHQVVLSDFTPEESLALAEGLSFPKDDLPEIVEWVHRWTNGHPYLTQLLFQVLEEQHRNVWLEKDVDECIRGFITSPEGLRDPNFQFVRTALTEPDANGATLLGPYLNLLKGKIGNLKTNQTALEQLRLIGVLRDDGDEIVIRNALYEEIFSPNWVMRHLHPLAAVSQSPTAQSVTWNRPAFQHSNIMAASLFLVGVGLLLWFFSRPFSQPVVVTEKNNPSESIETAAISTESAGIQSPAQSPNALKQSQEKIQELEATLVRNQELSSSNAHGLQEKIQELEATIVRYQDLSAGEAQGLIDQRTQLETQLAAKEDALSTLQTQVQTLRADLKDQQHAHDETIANLRNERAQSETKATIAAGDLETAQDELKTLQMAVLKKSSLSTSDVNKLMADRSQLDAQLHTTNTELALAHERARELESLVAQQKQLAQTENQQRAEDRAGLERKIKELETTIIDTRQTLSTTESTAQEQAKLAQTELSRLQQDRTKYQELLAASQEELSSLKTQTVNLTDTLGQKNQALQEKQQERDRLQTQLTQAREELNSANTQVATLGKQLSVTETKAADSQKALQAIHASSSEQATRAAKQATELALLRSTLPAQLQESQEALTKAQARIIQFESNSAKISETESNLRKTTEERDRYLQELQESQQQMAKAQDQIQTLEQSLRTASLAVKRGKADSPRSSTSEKKEDVVKLVSRITAKLLQSPSPIQSETAKLLWARQAYELNLRTQGTQWSTIDRSLRDGLHTSPIRLKGVSSKIHTLTFDPSGDHVIAGTSDGKMLLWSMNNPLNSPRVLTAHTASVLSTAVSPDGQYLASGSLDSTVRLWDLSQPTTSPRILQAHSKGATSLAFRPDGKELASGSQDHTIRLWDLTTDQPQAVTLGTHAGRVNAIAYTPDGKTLISGGDDLALRVWDLQRTESPPKILKGHNQSISTIAIHPFGWLVATGSRDRQIGLWNLRQSPTAPTFLSGSEGRISHVRFSTDGTSVVSVSSDKSLRIWNWQEPTQPPIQIPGHKGTLEALAISPDGRIIAVGGSGKNVTLWSGTGQLAHAVCDRARENLSFAEWKQIAGEEIPYERTCPNLPLHPTYLEEGKKLARQGDHEQAQAIFKRAKQLDPYLEIDPEIELKNLSARSS